MVGFNDVEEFDYGCCWLLEVSNASRVLNGSLQSSRDKMLMFFFHSGTLFLMVLLRLHGSDVAQWWKWKHLVMLDETRLHWKLINFGSFFFVLFFGGVRSVSFERDPSPSPPNVHSDVENFLVSWIRFLEVVSSSFTMLFSIFLYPR